MRKKRLLSLYVTVFPHPYNVVFVLLRFCGTSLTATGAATLASTLQNCPDINKIKYVIYLFVYLTEFHCYRDDMF